jgi:hypothetical protein
VIHFLHLLFSFGGAALAIAIYPPPPVGFHGWGGGSGPQGLHDSVGVAAKPGKLATSINQSVYVILAATGVPQRAPSMNVPAGVLVSIRAHNGTNAGNTNIVRIGRQPELLSGIEGDPITPDSDIAWPCDMLHEIWVVGTAGDGIRISIQAQRV